MDAISVGEYVVRIRVLFVLVAFWLLLFSQVTTAASVLAKAFFGSFDFKNSVVYLSLGDQVKDGCLPTPAAIKNAWEVELRRLGFQVVSEWDPSYYEFSVLALGYAHNKTNCSVILESEVFSLWVNVTIHSRLTKYAPISLWEKLAILSGPKEDMQSRIRDKARDHVNEFFLAVSQAKDSAQ